MVVSSYISKQLTTTLIGSKIIKQDEADSYMFCFEYVLDIIIYNLSLIILGVLLKDVVSSLIYILTVNTLKACAGGIHANSRIGCSILSYGIFITTILLAANINYNFNELPAHARVALICIYIGIALIVICLAPTLHPNQNLCKRNINKLKALTLTVLSAITLFEFIFIKLNQHRLYRLLFICVIITMLNEIIGRTIYYSGR